MQTSTLADIECSMLARGFDPLALTPEWAERLTPPRGSAVYTIELGPKRVELVTGAYAFGLAPCTNDGWARTVHWRLMVLMKAFLRGRVDRLPERAVDFLKYSALVATLSGEYHSRFAVDRASVFDRIRLEWEGFDKWKRERFDPAWSRLVRDTDAGDVRSVIGWYEPALSLLADRARLGIVDPDTDLVRAQEGYAHFERQSDPWTRPNRAALTEAHVAIPDLRALGAWFDLAGGAGQLSTFEEGVIRIATGRFKSALDAKLSESRNATLRAKECDKRKRPNDDPDVARARAAAENKHDPLAAVVRVEGERVSREALASLASNETGRTQQSRAKREALRRLLAGEKFDGRELARCARVSEATASRALADIENELRRKFEIG